MAQKILTLILGLLVVGGMAWYFNKNFIQKTTNSANTGDQKQVNSEAKIESNLFYTVKGAATEIWEVGSSLKAKKVYTDADESLKVLKFSNLAASTRQVMAVSSAGSKTSGKLILINLDEFKTKTLKELFSQPEILALSPDAKYFAYTRFSNAEADYGYTLYYEGVADGKIKEVYRSPVEFLDVAWNKDGTKFAYAVASGAKSEIYQYTLESSKRSLLLSLDQKIVDWISWDEEGILVVSVRKIGDKSSGEIATINPSSPELVKKASYSGGIASFVYPSPDRSSIAYLVAQYQGKIDPEIQGQIYILDLQNSKKTPLQKGNQILGWAL